MSNVKPEEKEPDTSSKVLNLIEARLDDQQDATKGLMSKAVDEIKEDNKSSNADISSMLLSMNERITTLEGRVTSKEDLKNNQKLLLGEIDKMVDKKAQKLYQKFRVPKKETACLGVQCSMSQVNRISSLSCLSYFTGEYTWNPRKKTTQKEKAYFNSSSLAKPEAYFYWCPKTN
jgi:hypothetical protein